MIGLLSLGILLVVTVAISKCQGETQLGDHQVEPLVC